MTEARSESRWLHVDLCCGLGGWQEPFRDSPQWRTVGLDVRRDLNPDIQADVRHAPLRACEPTLVTASPPCIEFTKYRLPWYHGGVESGPVDRTVADGCFEAVGSLEPDWWVVENVQGFHFFYGEPTRKWGPWWLWGEFPPFDPGPVVYKRQRFNVGEHERNAKVPYPLADALRKSVEVWEGA